MCKVRTISIMMITTMLSSLPRVTTFWIILSCRIDLPHIHTHSHKRLCFYPLFSPVILHSLMFFSNKHMHVQAEAHSKGRYCIFIYLFSFSSLGHDFPTGGHFAELQQRVHSELGGGWISHLLSKQAIPARIRFNEWGLHLHWKRNY